MRAAVRDAYTNAKARARAESLQSGSARLLPLPPQAREEQVSNLSFEMAADEPSSIVRDVSFGDFVAPKAAKSTT